MGWVIVIIAAVASCKVPEEYKYAFGYTVGAIVTAFKLI